MSSFSYIAKKKLISSNTGTEITVKNFFFHLYDSFFESKVCLKEEFNESSDKDSTEPLSQSLFKLELTKNKKDIPYASSEPFYFYIAFKDKFNILLFHESLRIKCSINQSETLWKNYTDFIKNNGIIEKYTSNTLTKKNYIDFLNYTKMNILDNNLEYIILEDELNDEYFRRENFCDTCGDGDGVLEMNGELVCTNCGLVIEKFLISTGNPGVEEDKDFSLFDTFEKKKLVFSNEKINESKEDEKILRSVDINNFTKKIDYLEGKQVIKPPVSFLEKVKVFFDTNKDEYLKGKTTDEIKHLKNNKERSKYFNVSILENVFKTFNQTEYSKDVEYISNKIFGWELIDLSDHREILLNDFIIIQKIYNKIKLRDTNLNINMRLVYQLFLIDKPIEKGSIKIIKSKESLKYHLDMFKKISKILKVDCTEFLKYFD